MLSVQRAYRVAELTARCDARLRLQDASPMFWANVASRLEESWRC